MNFVRSSSDSQPLQTNRELYIFTYCYPGARDGIKALTPPGEGIRTTTESDITANAGKLTIAQILTDEYNMNILAATSHKARSARELAFMFDIPLASCYRKLRELSSAGLIEHEGSELTADGKRYKVYRSRIGSVTMVYEKGTLHMKVDMNYRAAPLEIIQNMATPKPREL